jgi:hypothetical protein
LWRRVLFIYAAVTLRFATIHCAFRRSFRSLDSHCPVRHVGCAGKNVGLRTWQLRICIGRGGRRPWPLRASDRQFIRYLAWQFFGSWRLAGLLDRRRHLRAWIAGRLFPRRLRRLTRLNRGIFLWFDRHLQRHLAVIAEIGACAGNGRSRHLHVTGQRARRIPELGILRRDLQDADVWIFG